MKYLIGISLAVVLLAGSVAQAIPVPVQWYADNFESYAVPPDLRLRIATPNWVGGAGPENYIRDWGTGQAVRLKGSSGSGANSDAYTSTDGLTQSNFSSLSTGVSPQILDFTLQSDTAFQLPGYNHLYVKMLDSAGAEIGYWYGNSGGIAPRFGGTTIPGISIVDGAVHNFSITYDPLTGTTNWLHNGALYWTQARPAGMAVAKVYVQDQNRVDDLGVKINDHVYLDNVVVGTLPEPATLALLSLGVIPMLRRRR